MEAEGWFTYIEQAEDGKSHTVVITDDMDRFMPLDTQEVDFYRADRRTGADALVEWGSERIVQSVAYGMRTADYKRPSWPRERSGRSTDEHGDVPSEPEVYECAGAYRFPPRQEGRDQGSLVVQYRIEEYESRIKRFLGVGSVLTHLAKGETYGLSGGDLLAFGLHGTVVSPYFDRHPRMRTVLQASDKSPYAEAVARWDQSDWDAIARESIQYQ